MVQINLKRVYDGISSDDGKCFLVDRLWPRGISKIELEGVEWEKIGRASCRERVYGLV